MAAQSEVWSEIEVLQSIYLDELTVTRNDEGGWRISVVLHPSTGEDSLAQFVFLTLALDLDSEYPASPPCITIQHPRGLSDEKLLSLQRSLQLEAEEFVGTPVLYQLIEKVKEILTDSNVPHGSCVICLYGFKEGEVFTRTSCYHYFHSHCLGRYVTHSEEELQERVRELEEDKTRDGEVEELRVLCPVCREPLRYDANALLSSPLPDFPQEDESVSAEFKRKWAGLQKILDGQRERGGVIDPEFESNRFLIHINDPPVCDDTSDPPNFAQSLPPPPPPECLDQRPHPPVENKSNLSHRHASHSRRQQVEFRGGRRGGGHVARTVPLAVLENLTKLSVSSSVNSRNTEAPQNTSQHRDGQSVEVKDQLRQASGDECVRTGHQETPGAEHEHVTSDTAETGGRERGTMQEQERGRRYGARRPPFSHWHARNSLCDNSGNVHHRRGARGNRAGHHRGTRKNWHQRTESELRKEGVF